MTTSRDPFDVRLSAFVDRARIDCDKMFDYACPRYWAELTRTSDPRARFCGQCQRLVHLVGDEDEFRERARRGECVAVILADELPDPDSAGDGLSEALWSLATSPPPMMLGMPRMPAPRPALEPPGSRDDE